MFLRNLIIRNNSDIIRQIDFHKGINLIVDETSVKNITDSGNSVGKTTVLRLIDFCLDGNGKNIYIDPEFKNTNKKIENFLKKNNIIISLSITKNLDYPSYHDVVVERNFLTHSKKIQEINGESFSNTEFSHQLKKLLFESESEKPTFKQLKSKNIRDEKNKLVNTLKVLDSFTTDVEYEQLFLFWLGIDSDHSKDKIVRDLNLEEKIQTRLRKDSNLSQITQSLIVLDKSISELELKRSKFNLNEKYEDTLSELNAAKSQINSVTTQISRLELRKELIIESKDNLEKERSNINVDAVKALYKKARVFIPNLQKTFEESLQFHNQMIEKKLDFIIKELPEINAKMSALKRELTNLISKEKSLSEDLNKQGAIEDLQSIVNKLNELYERKGNLEEQKRIWEDSNNSYNKLKEKLDVINKDIQSKDELIQSRVEKFNTFFSEISRRLDGVHSVLSAEIENGVYKFRIGNVEGNPGTGGKKSQMASFDLAYIQFADELEIPCLHFILQDQIENVHSNQITNLLTEIVSEVNCQYILPVLRDKLPQELDLSHLEILSLSQKNKLFKLE